MRRYVGITVLVCMSAFANEESPIEVRVLADGEQCVVNDRQIRCDAVGKYLRDPLRVALDHPISVFVDGTKQSEARGRRVGDLIHGAGYSKIVTVGFLTEPDHGIKGK